MELFGKIVVFLFLMLIPLYLWAYVVTISDTRSGVRSRFYAGLFSGIFSVGATFFFARFLQDENFFKIFLIFSLILVGFYGIIFVITQFWSQFSRSFIRKISFWHIFGIGTIFLLILFFSKNFLWNIFWGAMIFSVFLPAFFEEITKHLGVMWLLGKNFSFSLRDLTIFAFCVVAGFTFIENFLYFYTGNVTNFGVLTRSIFTFSAHLFAVLISVFFWWKALSYRFLSLKYFFWFSLGFLLSVGAHFLFNFSLSIGQNWVILPFLLSAYGLFVFLLQKDN